MAFDSLGELGAGAAGDVIQVAAVGGGLFSQGLHQARLQGQQLLRILDAENGLRMVGAFRQSGF